MKGLKPLGRRRRVRLLIFDFFFRAKPFSIKIHPAALPYPELLAYAQSLSAFTSAPPNMPDMTAPGQPPPPLFFPPFPNEEKMRRGRLNAEAPLGMLGETHSVGQRKFYISAHKFWYQITHYPLAPTTSPEKPDIAIPVPLHGNPYRQDHPPQQGVFDLDLDLNPDF